MLTTGSLSSVSVAGAAKVTYFCQGMAAKTYVDRILCALKERGHLGGWLERQLNAHRGTTGRGYMSKLRSQGRRGVDIEIADTIAQILDVDPCWLVLGRGEMRQYGEDRRIRPIVLPESKRTKKRPRTAPSLPAESKRAPRASKQS